MNNTDNILIPSWADCPKNVCAFTTLRFGGNSLTPYDDGKSGKNGFNLASHVGDNPEHVAKNREILRKLLPSEPAWLTQTHSSIVLNAQNVKNAPEGDATYTTERNIVCVAMTADCLPVLLSDIKGKIVSAVHAGWRGLADGIVEEAVKTMRDNGAKEITAWLGPAIGPQKFEVGEDVLSAFLKRGKNRKQGFTPLEKKGQYLADMYSLARMSLNEQGVTRIHGGELCTFSEESRFYSFRRNEITGRMASLIWIK